MSKQYKNPPITEAVCEFRFELENTFDQKEIDLFFENIKEKFPKKKKGQLFQAEVKVDTKEKKQEVSSKIVREFDQFFSEDEKSLIQLDKDRLSIHKLRPYGSWEEFYSLISLAFNSYVENIKIKSIQRIGLRYINDINLPPNKFIMEKLFNLYPYLGGDLPKEMVSFLLGVVLPFENNRDYARIQLIDQSKSIENIVIRLDIDYFLAQPKTVKQEEALGWVNIAHEHLEKIFENSISEEIKQIFNQ